MAISSYSEILAKDIKGEFSNCVGYGTNSTKISGFTSGTPAASDKILFEQNGNGRSTTVENLRKITGINVDLLWSNDNTETAFSARVIPLDLSNYKLVYIKLIYLMEDGASGYLLLPVGEETSFSTAYFSYQYVVLRRFPVHSNSIEIGDGLKNGTVDNSVLIPKCAYGIK